jgi:hypothetical protein
MAQTCHKTDRVSMARHVPSKRLARQHNGSSGGAGKAAPAQRWVCSLLVQSGATDPFSSREA